MPFEWFWLVYRWHIFGLLFLVVAVFGVFCLAVRKTHRWPLFCFIASVVAVVSVFGVAWHTAQDDTYGIVSGRLLHAYDYENVLTQHFLLLDEPICCDGESVRLLDAVVDRDLPFVDGCGRLDIGERERVPRGTICTGDKVLVLCRSRGIVHESIYAIYGLGYDTSYRHHTTGHTMLDIGFEDVVDYLVTDVLTPGERVSFAGSEECEYVRQADPYVYDCLVFQESDYFKNIPALPWD